MRVLCVELEQCSWWCRLWCRRENYVFLKNYSYFCFILFCLQLAINCIKKNNDKKKKFVSFFILFLLFIKKRKINVKHLFIRFKLIFLFSFFFFYYFLFLFKSWFFNVFSSRVGLFVFCSYFFEFWVKNY